MFCGKNYILFAVVAGCCGHLSNVAACCVLLSSSCCGGCYHSVVVVVVVACPMLRRNKELGCVA